MIFHAMPPVLNPYDEFAWFYDRYWAEPFQRWHLPALDALLLRDLPPGAHLLDICCGSGHLARVLTSRGFRVTGVDSSEGMLAHARRNAPSANFLQADLAIEGGAPFPLPAPAHAALCTFDSINHLLHPAALLALLQRVANSLLPGSPFVFDVNTPAAYGERWNSSASVVEPDHAFFLRGHFDPVRHLGHTHLTTFRLFDQWLRTDAEFCQRPWEIVELSALLSSAGFSRIEHWRAIEDLGLEGHYGFGRVYIRACSPS